MTEQNADYERAQSSIAPTCPHCGCAILPGTEHKESTQKVMGTYGWCVQIDSYGAES